MDIQYVGWKPMGRPGENWSWRKPRTTLKQKIKAISGKYCLLPINDNSQTKFFISWLQSRVASGKPLLTKRPAQLKLVKSTSSLPKPCGIICFGLMRVKLNIVAIIPEEMFATKETPHPQKNSIPTVQHGGRTIMFWGYFSTAGVGVLIMRE